MMMMMMMSYSSRPHTEYRIYIFVSRALASYLIAALENVKDVEPDASVAIIFVSNSCFNCALAFKVEELVPVPVPLLQLSCRRARQESAVQTNIVLLMD